MSVNETLGYQGAKRSAFALMGTLIIVLGLTLALSPAASGQAWADGGSNTVTVSKDPVTYLTPGKSYVLISNNQPYAMSSDVYDPSYGMFKKEVVQVTASLVNSNCSDVTFESADAAAKCIWYADGEPYRTGLSFNGKHIGYYYTPQYTDGRVMYIEGQYLVYSDINNAWGFGPDMLEEIDIAYIGLEGVDAFSSSSQSPNFAEAYEVQTASLGAKAMAKQTISGKAKISKTLKANKKCRLAKNTTVAQLGKGKTKTTYKAVYSGKNKNVAKKYIKVSKSGKVTAKKGLKTGTYKLTVTATAKKTAQYNKATKKFIITVKVKKPKASEVKKTAADKLTAAS